MLSFLFTSPTPVDVAGDPSVYCLLSTVYSPLAFSLINPGFAVAGLLLVALPITIHILNRRRFRTINWAAMEYLLAAMRKNRRRLKFEQWLLLATRCLLLALLGLALARPLGCADSTLASVGQRVGLHVIVIDNSYSMAYEADRPNARTHLDQAKLIAKSLVERLSGEEAVILITAGAPAQAVIATPAYEFESVRASIDRIEQGYGGTDLSDALRIAADISADVSMPKRNLYLITDGTRSAFDGRSAADLPALAQRLAGEFKLRHYHLGKPGQWNHAILDVRPTSSLVTSKFDSDFRADLKGFGSGPETLMQWKLDDEVMPGGSMLSLDLDTPPQTRSTTFREGGTHVIGVSVVSDDRLKLDNTQHHVVAVASELKTLIVEGFRGNSALEGSAAFLDLALAPPTEPGAAGPAGVRSNSYVSTEVISDIQLGNKVLGDYRAVILTNVSQISASVADQLRHYVAGGGTLLIFMGDQVNSESYNQSLLPRQLLPGPLVKQVNTAADQAGYQFDFTPSNVRSSYLKVFENQPSSGLDTARVYTYVQLALPSDSTAERVLDFRSSGSESTSTTKDPAITVHSLEQGRIIFVATTADPQWTSFPAKPAYVVLMHELLTGSVDGGDAWMNLEVGQPVVVPRDVKLTTTPALIDATQRETPLAAVTDEQNTAYRSEPMARPGLYRLVTGTGTLPIAVNPPAAEADVRTLEDGAIKAALGDIELALERDAIATAAADEDDGRDFGWILLAMLLIFVGFESFLAMRFGHYRR